MDITGSELISSYNETSGINREVLDLFIVNYTGLNRYSTIGFLERVLSHGKSTNEYQKAISSLVRGNLIISSSDEYDVPMELKIKLFPTLIQQERWTKVLRKIQADSRFNYNPSVTQFIRDYFFAGFVEENENVGATERLLLRIREALPIFRLILYLPEYDKALMHSPKFISRLMDLIHLNNILYFSDFHITTQFFKRNPNSEVLHGVAPVQLLEIRFQSGKIDDSYDVLKEGHHLAALLLKSQVELFQGRFAQSAKTFELARIVSKEGTHPTATEFNLYFEFFYWLNFVFYPEGLNLKKVEATIKKCEKNKIADDGYLLPLLYYVKKDRSRAEEILSRFLVSSLVFYSDFHGFLYLLLHFILFGSLSKELHELAGELSVKFVEGKRWLFLRELDYMAKESGWDTDRAVAVRAEDKNELPCLMSQLTSQEKWEEMLEGLLNLTRGKPVTGKKEAASSRVCYLVEMNHGFIQPVLQTISAKGVWSSGRNISLKRMKEQAVEGMTEQDRRLAAAITHTTGYYSASEYNLEFYRGLTELCGHPLLFLAASPTVSLELIKAQAEIITQNVKDGIKLKTNIINSDQKVVLIKETQTRYKLITLSLQQQTIIRMIKEGVTVPVKGKAKLLETVSGLSSIMTVHSDITGETGSVKSIAGDSRIRIQIIPVGNGLKAEMFVKPLGLEPPYTKPGKGGKVVYGTLNGEKFQAVRDLAAESHNSDTLNEAISMALDTDLTEDAATFSDPYQCLDLLEILGRYPDISVIEWPEGERFRLRKSASWSNLNLRIKGRGQWFELDGELKVDEEIILSLQELIGLTKKSKGRFIELKTGEFLALTEDLKKHLDELETFVSMDKKGISMNRFAAHALDEIAGKAGSFKSDKLWKEFQKLIQGQSFTDAVIPAAFDGDLRLYQEEGFRWMTRLKSWGAGACLADDMGLGKTVQAIAMMLHLAESGPVMVVCPASVVSNWAHELHKFAPTLNPVILKPGNRADVFASLEAFDVMVITYGLLQTEEERIAKITWSMAVLDEAHAIKNTNTKSSKSAMNIHAGFKLAMTGTPIQNHLGELWNLFNYCNPGLLGTLSQFTDRFVKDDLPSQKIHLKKLITPFILRRTKNKVLDELPPKTEITHVVQLSDKEMAFYESLRREAVKAIENNNGPQGQQHLQALVEITKLRLACCNSTLVNKNIVLPSAKLEAFFEIFEELRANRHRALVFSQFVGHLSLVRKELDQQGISYQYLDGSTSLPNRELAVKDFQSGKGELFLISLKAGGLGLNLTAADYVLHLDPWWNPAIEDQASDRAHRIGQLRPVTIYRLVAKNTIEEKIVKLHATKRDLADSLLEGADQSARLSTVDLLNLLKDIGS